MKKVYNIFIPAHGFRAMTIWPFIFVRLEEKREYNDVDDRHETIHGEQQKEMLCVAVIIVAILFAVGCAWWCCLIPLPLFFYWYLTEWLLRKLFGKGNAYRNISFEREAFANERNEGYLSKRKRFAWIKYINNNDIWHRK